MEEEKWCIDCKYVWLDEDGGVWCKRGYPRKTILGTEFAQRSPKELICENIEEY